jgi:hypothetical protein
MEGVKSLSNSHLEVHGGRHHYYHQCQGHMTILDKPWVDVVIRVAEPHDMCIERIWRDTAFWDSVMLPRLSGFYHCAVLPELAVPRHGQYPGIREPGPGWVGIPVWD